jgi:hypothetical protein
MTYGSMTVESSLLQNSFLEFPVANNGNHENLIPTWESDMLLRCKKIACTQCENASLNA